MVRPALMKFTILHPMAQNCRIMLRRRKDRMLWYKALSASLMLGFVPLAAHGASWVQYWRQLDHSAYVQVGHGPVVVYDFFDPNCSYCPVPYKLEQQFIQKEN
jgi:hypothetical protein